MDADAAGKRRDAAALAIECAFDSDREMATSRAVIYLPVLPGSCVFPGRMEAHDRSEGVGSITGYRRERVEPAAIHVVYRRILTKYSQ